MTTFAQSEPALRRMFEELDYVPEPQSEVLRAVLETWRAERGDAVFPPIAAFAISSKVPSATFLFTIADRRDFLLRAAGSEFDHLLGALKAGDRLSESPRPRSAARLRRLFDAVCEAGEPILAEYHAGDTGEFVEVLAAPVTADGKTVAGVFGGAVWRPSPLPSARPLRVREDGPIVFALASSAEFGERVCRHLAVTLARPEERSFEDGEFKIRPLVNVRNRDVYVIASLNGDEKASANDKLCRLLFLMGALKDAAAARVTAVTPYLCYGRKDRQTKLRDPVSSRYVAQLFEAIGTDRLVTLEAHNLAAFQNAFRCDTEHLDADMLFSRRILALIGARDVAVISPDTGGVKRAERFRERLETQLGRPVASGFMEKRRSAGVVSGDTLVADVRDKAVVIVDDLISTGGTMRRAAAACRAAGATAIYAAAAHGLLNRGAGETLSGAEFDRILITDSVPPPPAEAGKITDRLEVVSVAGLFGEAIRRCHSGGSITDLLERGA